MGIESSARIAILGAGPIGIEAALYARFLGYTVDVYERGRLAENIQRWGHVQLFSPVSLNCSPLGMAALKAQYPDLQVPPPDLLQTGHEFVSTYLAPLAQSDLLCDSIHTDVEVIGVGRTGMLKQDLSHDSHRADEAFRIVTRSSADGSETSRTADVVIDTTGVYGNHRWLGQGGIPAPGEQQATIEYGLPDVRGAERAAYQGQHVLVVGGGYSAATTVAALAELAAEDRQTTVTWITRNRGSQALPLPQIPNDPLAARAGLVRGVNQLIAEGSQSVTWHAETSVDAIRPRPNGKAGYEVDLVGHQQQCLSCDRIVGNVGYRPDATLYRELHVQSCYATEGPMPLAAALLQEQSNDCLKIEGSGPDLLQVGEPNFFLLGSKSFGRNPHFLLSIGQRQIRDLFALLGGREDLDLYQNVQYLAVS